MNNYKKADKLFLELYKECKNGKGYIGVEEGNWHEDTEQKNVELLFFRIAWERDVLAQNSDDYIEGNRNYEDAPFRTNYHVELHRKRLAKFFNKHKALGTFTETEL